MEASIEVHLVRIGHEQTFVALGFSEDSVTVLADGDIFESYGPYSMRDCSKREWMRRLGI